MTFMTGLNGTLGFGAIWSAVWSFIVLIFVVFAAFYVSRWYAKKMQNGGFTGGGKYIKVIDRISLGPSASLAIVEVEGKCYFVGLSDKNIQLLSELPAFEVSEIPDNMPGEPFSAMLRKLMEKANPGTKGGSE